MLFSCNYEKQVIFLIARNIKNMFEELFFNVLIDTSCLAVFNRYIKYFAIFA